MQVLESEEDISAAVGSADAVVFAAGAGPGSGAARKLTMDRDGAIKLIAAAQRNGIGRYVMISAMHAEEPRGDEVFQTYLRAKSAFNGEQVESAHHVLAVTGDQVPLDLADILDAVVLYSPY